MKNLIVALIGVLMVLVLVGCKEDSQPAAPELVQTVEWYKANEQARKDMLAQCRNNPGELAANANCVNASNAQNSVTWSSRSSGIKNVEAPKF